MMRLAGQAGEMLGVRTWGARTGNVLGTAVLVCIPVALFYPGLMNADSLDMYANARAGGPASDWHSPMLVYFWRALLRLGLDVAAFTLIQSAIYVVSLAWLLACTGLSWLMRLVVLAAILAVPPTMTWLATLEKTTVAACLICACLAISLALEVSPRRRGWQLFLLLAVALAGVGTRPNGILIFAPIAADGAWRSFGPGRRRYAMATVSVFLALAIGLPVFGAALSGIQRRYPEQTLLTLDLMNLSMRTGHDLLPRGALTVPFATAAAAMVEQPLPPFGGRFSGVTLIANGLVPLTRDERAVRALRVSWLEAVVSNPLEYLRYRTEVFLNFNCFDPEIICYDAWHWYSGGIDRPNPFGLVSRNVGPVFALYRSWAGSVFYRPYFHASLVLLVLGLAIWRRRRTVAVYAAILIAFYFCNALLIPSISVRMVIPLGMMVPPLVVGLFQPAAGRQPHEPSAAAVG